MSQTGKHWQIRRKRQEQSPTAGRCTRELRKERTARYEFAVNAKGIQLERPLKTSIAGASKLGSQGMGHRNRLLGRVPVLVEVRLKCYAILAVGGRHGV
ncbi:uncharacterized protein SPSK_10670 [Sporothrix schenckii 1099-18]|uniref:Uncharacterized protein n=1 Tax=Sporothrix schenckii 1099-18 TaxID=1397361 RepID=A0A0F2LVE6_SPOSC|nr:uncharacterized protein SPSK_10670 [Sporothrix schenckii 1099-18]KJR80824.1 hypothetical protein SPSK_10670 [Sporothrix schenckii 1099-18]